MITSRLAQAFFDTMKLNIPHPDMIFVGAIMLAEAIIEDQAGNFNVSRARPTFNGTPLMIEFDRTDEWAFGRRDMPYDASTEPCDYARHTKTGMTIYHTGKL